MKPGSAKQYMMLVATAVAIMALAVLALAFLDSTDPGQTPERGPVSSEAPRSGRPEDAFVPEAEPKRTPLPAEMHTPAGAVTVVSGKVIGEGGAPVAGHKVILAVPFSDGAELPHVAALFTMAANPGQHFWPEARSDADGSFELRTGRRGQGMILAGPPSFAVVSVPCALEGRPVVVEVKLDPGFRVAGIVLEKETGLPATGVAVTAIQAATPAAIKRQSVTMADGRFEASGFAAGEVKLTVDPPGGAWVDSGWVSTTNVRAGDTNVEICVFRVGIVSFKAQAAPDMKPFSGVIRAYVMSEPDASAVVYSENHGDFTLRGPSGTHTYALWPQGMAPVAVTFATEPEKQVTRPEPVIFKKGVAFTGTVELPEDPGLGMPRSAAVYVESLDPHLNRVLMCDFRLEGKNHAEFAFDDLPPGLHRVVAFARGFGMFRSTVVLSEERTTMRILLPRNDEGAVFTGMPLAQRRGLIIDVALTDLTDFEAVLLLAAVSDTALKFNVSQAVAADAVRKDMRISARLLDAVRTVKTVWKLDFDPETGVFSKR